MENENVILKLSFEFALDIIAFAEQLQECKKFVISKQILKSGTSVGANIREAQSAESKADFIHKFKIAIKELEETEYWLDLCKHSSNYPYDEELMEKLQVLKRISGKIVSTSRKTQ